MATAAYQEGLWELLITALYRAGRQADALAAYRRVRALLADELGLEPGPAPAAARAAGPQPRPGARAARAAAGNLPSLATRSSGARRRSPPSPACSRPSGSSRSSGRAASARRRSRSRPAERCPRPAAVSGSPGWKAPRRPTTSSTRCSPRCGSPAARRRCSSGSGRRPTVVILDNCEHVVDAAAALAARLLDAAPACGSCAPARSRSTSTAKPVFELAPLALPDAVELFRRRAAARHGDTADDVVAGLCRSLDGLPLAIELAAARTRTLSIEEITRRLDDRFSVLQRPGQPQARAPPRAEGDDRLELRAALPRRPARPVGAGRVRRRRAAARGRVGARGARRARVGGDRRGRTARGPLARDRRRRRPVARTGCSTASARSRSTRWRRPG